MTVQAVFFDLDGTLIDTAPDFAVVVAQLCTEYAVAVPDPEAIRAQVSHGATALVSLALGTTPEQPEHETARQRLLALYETQNHRLSRPFPGIPEILHWLGERSIPWGIATNKPLCYSEALLAVLSLQPPCAALVCPDHVTHRKPHAEPLLKACALTGSEPARCVYVGDHRRDIESGRNAELYTVAAAYGYLADEDRIDDWQADSVIASADELPGLLHTLNL